jgi:hypothetical protein
LRTRFCSFLVHDSLKSYWTCKKRSEVFTGTKLEAFTVVDAYRIFKGAWSFTHQHIVLSPFIRFLSVISSANM